jgi:hypothetical protein
MLILLFLPLIFSQEWVQILSPSRNHVWVRQDPFDPILPVALTETKFEIFTPFDGDSIMPDTISYINWKTYPRYGGSSPTDVQISLWVFNQEDLTLVSITTHSVPNLESWMWIAPTLHWSNDDWFVLRICSLDDTDSCSESSRFRIINPYAFYP